MGLKLAKKSTDTSDTSTDDLVALRAENERLKSQQSTLLSERDRERQGRITAERAGMSAQERELVAAEDAAGSDISRLESDLQQAEDEIARLSDEPGNGKAIAALNRKMATSAAELLRATDRKAYLADQRTKLKTSHETRQARQTEEESGDDRLLANGAKLSAFPKITQEWLLAHPKAFTDRRYLGQCITAVTKGIQVEGLKDNSPELLNFVSQEIGDDADDQEDDQDDQEEEGQEVETTRQTRPADEERYEAENPQHRAAGKGTMRGPAAPSHRATVGTGERRQRRVSLTADEREVADGLYASIKNPADRYIKYAENKKIMDSRETGHFAGRA